MLTLDQINRYYQRLMDQDHPVEKRIRVLTILNNALSRILKEQREIFRAEGKLNRAQPRKFISRKDLKK